MSDGIVTVGYSIEGVVYPGDDNTMHQTMITVDDVRPVVQFSSVPLVLNNEELETLQFSLQIVDEGGLPSGDLDVNWAFLRNGLIMQNAQFSSIIPFISENYGTYTYAGSVDFSEGTNITFEEGDELIWWIDVIDRAGNEAKGTGLSFIDSMNTDFTVLSFDVTVTNIDITLADGSIPKANQIVEGDELGFTVQLRNLRKQNREWFMLHCTKDMGTDRTWLAYETQELTLMPGQTMATQPLLFETYKDGSQNIYINISGMDMWLNNSQLPHCSGFEDLASCDLSVETDMPRVVSQESVQSGIDGTTATISILVILLVGAGFAITVLLRRQNEDEDSIFYDDDDDDDEDEWTANDYGDQKVTPVLPPLVEDQSIALEEKNNPDTIETSEDSNLQDNNSSDSVENVNEESSVTLNPK